MTNRTDESAYASYGGPAAQKWDGMQTDESVKRTRSVRRSLWAAAVVLGAATYAVSLVPSAGIGFSVRLAVLAAAIAAMEFLPRQSGRGWIAVALAITGSLDALATWIAVSSSDDWTSTVIFVLSALQALVALGALLSETRARPAIPAVEQDYSAYASYAAAYQAYTAHYHQSAAPYETAEQAGAQAQGVGHMRAGAPGRGNDATSDPEALRAKYAQYGWYSTADPARDLAGRPTVAGIGDPGIPGAREAPHNQQIHRRERIVGEEAST